MISLFLCFYDYKNPTEKLQGVLNSANIRLNSESIPGHSQHGMLALETLHVLSLWGTAISSNLSSASLFPHFLSSASNEGFLLI